LTRRYYYVMCNCKAMVRNNINNIIEVRKELAQLTIASGGSIVTPKPLGIPNRPPRGFTFLGKGRL